MQCVDVVGYTNRGGGGGHRQLLRAGKRWEQSGESQKSLWFPRRSGNLLDRGLHPDRATEMVARAQAVSYRRESSPGAPGC